MSLRICYIGAGNFSNTFMFPQLREHDVELAGICDLQADKAEAAVRQYGFRGAYSDFAAMLDAERPDAVFCVGGGPVHYAVGMQVLEMGYHLYTQKPPTPTAEQTREMADMARKQNVVCHVGFNLRSSGAVQMTKRLIESGELGDPTLMIYRYGLVSGRTWQDAIIDQHAHAADTVRYLMGEVASAHVEPVLRDGARGYVASLRMESGAMVALCTTSEQDIRDEFIYFEVTGRDRHYVISHDGDLRYHRPDGADECLRAGTYYPGRLREYLGYVEDVRNFLAAVRGEEADRCPVADTTSTMALLSEIYQQCRQKGAPV